MRRIDACAVVAGVVKVDFVVVVVADVVVGRLGCLRRLYWRRRWQSKMVRIEGWRTCPWRWMNLYVCVGLGSVGWSERQCLNWRSCGLKCEHAFVD